MFSTMSFIVPVISLIVIGMFVFFIVKGIGEWGRNNNEPVLSVDCRVVAKRTHVSGHENSSSTYYVTFEVESGDRMEFRVKGNEFGMLAEGDLGKLTFQGTRYHGFKRA